jgi:MFS family permease
MRALLSRWGPFVPALGVTQIIGYGAVYYAYPILVPHIAAEFAVSSTTLYAILSAGLLIGGLLAPLLGRALDRFGAPQVMAAGSALAGGLSLALAYAPNLATFAILIIALESLAFAVTYDAAFATLAGKEPQDTRTAITRLTLFGGFASTLFWPLTGFLAEEVGWRGTYMVYAGLHLGLALPLHAWIAWQPARSDAKAPPEKRPRPRFAPLTPARVNYGFWALGLSFAVTGMVIAAIGVHLMPVLLARDLGQMAYVIGMLMGPAQVGVRLIEAGFWRNWHPVSVALISGVAVPLSLLALLVPWDSVLLAAVFAILFGAGQGLASIVRGSVPLVLFGSHGIGARLGQLAALRVVMGAAAPLVFALGLAGLGTDWTLVLSVLLACIGLAALLLLRRDLIAQGRWNRLVE